MYISTWIIVLIIVILSYLIYKRRKPSEISKTEAKENMQEQIEQKEKFLRAKIKTRDLEENIENGSEVALFDCGKHNFICLSERFKHDDIKLEQVIKDWIDYMDLLSDRVYEMTILHHLSSEDSPKHFDAREKIDITIREINKRFKDLLTNDYWDVDELQKLRQKEINELY